MANPQLFQKVHRASLGIFFAASTSLSTMAFAGTTSQMGGPVSEDTSAHQSETRVLLAAATEHDKNDDHDDHNEGDGEDHDKAEEPDHDDHEDHKEGDGEDHDKAEEPGHDDHEDEHGDGHDEEKSGGLNISPEGKKIASVEITPITLQPLPSLISAPGEVQVNEYAASVVTPRIPAIIQNRYAVLGQAVDVGTRLATLFSVEMADAQGDHLVASQEWHRVKKLGKGIVSDKRFTETYLAFQQSKAKLETYGMSADAIRVLTESGKAKNLGFFDLVADQKGVIVTDAFRKGELIEPGRAVFEVVDESTVWVNAKISIEQSGSVKTGAKAIVRFGQESRKATVKHVLSQMDEKTRTVSLRLELANEERRFKPGQFVEVDILLDPKPVLSVPTESIVTSPDGDAAVFVEGDDGKLVPREIETVRQTRDRTVIRGLPEGTRVVTRGAFFVQSEVAKGSFQVHNH